MRQSPSLTVVSGTTGFTGTAGILAVLAALTLPASYGRNWILSNQPNGGTVLGAYAHFMVLTQIVSTFMVYGGVSVYNYYMPKQKSAIERGRLIIGNSALSSVCVLIAIALVIIIPKAPRIVFGDIHPSHETLLLLCAIPAIAFSTLVTSAVLGLGYFRVVAVYEIFFILVPLISLAFLFGRDSGVDSVAQLGWIIVSWFVVSGLIMWLIFVRPHCDILVGEISLPKGFWGFGGAIYLITAISFFYQYFDQILISRYLSTAKLGEFFLIVQIAQLVTFVPQKLSQFALHELSRQSNADHIERTYHRAASLSIWAVTTIAAVVITSVPLLLKLFGETVTAEGESGLILLAAGSSTSALGALNSMLILARRETFFFTITNGIMISAQAAVNFWLIPTLGIQGAVWGRIVAIVIGQTGLYLIVRNRIFNGLSIPRAYWLCQAAIWTMVLVPGIGVGGRALITSLVGILALFNLLNSHTAHRKA